MIGRAVTGLALVALLTGCTSQVSSESRPAARPASTAQLKSAAALEPCAAGSSGPAAVPSQLPDLSLPCLGDGPPVRLGALHGVPTVVNLWAAWCGPCREEVPAFQRLYAAAAGRVRVLGVLTEDTERNALDAAAHLGMHYPSVVDGEGRLLDRSGVRALPVTYFVEASGRTHRYVGRALTYDALRQLVDQYLGVRV